MRVGAVQVVWDVLAGVLGFGGSLLGLHGLRLRAARRGGGRLILLGIVLCLLGVLAARR